MLTALLRINRPPVSRALGPSQSTDVRQASRTRFWRRTTIDRFTNSAYDLVIEGESYRTRLKPTLKPAPPSRKAAASQG